MADDFKFVRPLEAPAFFPTKEEFADPLAYIKKISPEAERYGICKIKPPYGWNPPFALDKKRFKFVPRIQKINEVEATSRLKMVFLDQLMAFCTKQNIVLSEVENSIDFYLFNQLVHSNEFRNSKHRGDKKWHMIAARMGLPSSGKASVGGTLKEVYNRILLPMSQERTNYEPPVNSNKRKNQRRMGGRKSKIVRFGDDAGNEICETCQTGPYGEQQMIQCVLCEKRFHQFCVSSPEGISKAWQCSTCAKGNELCADPGFGFDQAEKEYTLSQFEKKANEFKSSYFQKDAKSVSLEQVEREFWRIASNPDVEVTVEYGADLHTKEHGSGFPVGDVDDEYANSGWNLNKLPLLHGSALAHTDYEIPGMKTPWLYVGMCFSTFCWHTEDHWTSSINYLHSGEAKTWYGVSGGDAEIFERVMKSEVPELFAQCPDLLHQLVTMMNPNIFMKAGVNVYRLDQKAGEFVITFPRAYHAGFNQGYNVAEATNFALADWVQMGRECIQNYAKLQRGCVFSHDELVWGMAEEPEKLDATFALAIYEDLKKMQATETGERKQAAAKGVKCFEKKNLESLNDNVRTCSACKTILYLSAVTCIHYEDEKNSEETDLSGEKSVMVCPRHLDLHGCQECKLKPANYVLLYRHASKDIDEMVERLKNYTMPDQEWTSSVKDILAGSRKTSIQGLRKLIEEGTTNGYTQGGLLDQSEKLLDGAERIQEKARGILNDNCIAPANMDRQMFATQPRCDIWSLENFIQEMKNLSVTLPEMERCVVLYQRAKSMQQKTIAVYNSSLSSIDEMQNCLQEAQNLDVDFAEIRCLKSKLDQKKWLKTANEALAKEKYNMDELWEIFEDGTNLADRNHLVERRMADLAIYFQQIYDWEDEATTIINNSTDMNNFSKVVAHIDKGRKIRGELPTLGILEKILQQLTEMQQPSTSKRKTEETNDHQKYKTLRINN